MGRFPSCSICSESFRDFADIGACACGHTFHHNCFVKWTNKCRSRGQSPNCPTCQEPVENKPASGLIPKLFFSFDDHNGPINFDDEFLAKEMDRNDTLESEATMLKAEINQLRLQMKESDAQLKLQEENEMAQANHFRKKIDEKDAALKDASERLSLVKAEWRRTEEALEKGKAQWKRTEEALEKEKQMKKHVDELLKTENSVVKRTVDLLSICQQENSELMRNLEVLKRQADEAERKIFIWNMHFGARESQLRVRTNLEITHYISTSMIFVSITFKKRIIITSFRRTFAHGLLKMWSFTTTAVVLSERRLSFLGALMMPKKPLNVAVELYCSAES